MSRVYPTSSVALALKTRKCLEIQGKHYLPSMLVLSWEEEDYAGEDQPKGYTRYFLSVYFVCYQAVPGTAQNNWEPVPRTDRALRVYVDYDLPDDFFRGRDLILPLKDCPDFTLDLINHYMPPEPRLGGNS